MIIRWSASQTAGPSTVLLFAVCSWKSKGMRDSTLSLQVCLQWPAQPLCHRSYTFGKLQLSVPWQGLKTLVIKNYKEQRNIMGSQHKSRDDNSWSSCLDLGALFVRVEGIVALGEKSMMFHQFLQEYIAELTKFMRLPQDIWQVHIYVSSHLPPRLLTSGPQLCCPGWYKGWQQGLLE